MPDRLEPVRDRPEVFLGGHPADAVESDERPRRGMTAEGLLAPQIEVRLEVRQDERADRRPDRLAVAEARVVRARDRSPAAPLAKDGDHVVVVLDRLEVEDERRAPLDPERGGGEQRAVHALDGALANRAPRGAAVLPAHVVIEAVEALLDPPRRIEAAEETRLPVGQAEVFHRSPAHVNGSGGVSQAR